MRSAVPAALIAMLTWGGVAVADHYPSRAITVVVPFSVGGPSDAMARILAQRMQATLGASIVIETLQYVPYRGTAPAMNDLVAGQIDLMIDQTANSIVKWWPMIRAANVRAVGAL
jgi:tripartite-type tricarboxylate transporter receptor subunit TctC